MTGLTNIVEQLGLHQVHLAQVWLSRVSSHAGAMLNLRASVRVAGDPDACDQIDRVHLLLAERVFWVAMNGDNDW